MAVYEPGNVPKKVIKSASTLTLDFLASRMVRNKFPLFMSHLIDGILLCQP